MASSVFVQAQEITPQSLYNEAGKALEAGDAKKAIALYTELLQKAPDSVEARTNLGVALAHEGRYREAVAQYHDVLKRVPNNRIVLLNLALAFYKQGNFENARTGLDKLHTLDPDNKQALYLLADCYLRLGRYRDVIVLLEPEYKMHPEDPTVDYALGTALIQDEQTKKGGELIDYALKNDALAVASLLIGASQYASGDYKNAIGTLHKALDLNPNLPGAGPFMAEPC